MKEYLRLSEKTEKKFPNGLELTVTQRTQIINALALAKIAGDACDQLKRHLIYGAESKFTHNSPQVHSMPAHLTQFQAEMLHMLLGSITEPAEAANHFLSYLLGEVDLDTVNLAEEGGDTMWYLAGYFRLLETGFNEEADRNIAKLKARFGDKFSEDAALNRDLEKERAVLES